MDVHTDTTPSSGPRRASRGVATSAVIGVLAAVGVAMLALVDRIQVQAQQELGRVEFGVPLTWVTQDQGIDPPLPYDTRLLPPWDNPTAVDWLPLLANVVVVALVLAAAWHGAAAAVRHARASR